MSSVVEELAVIEEILKQLHKQVSDIREDLCKNTRGMNCWEYYRCDMKENCYAYAANLGRYCWHHEIASLILCERHCDSCTFKMLVSKEDNRQ